MFSPVSFSATVIPSPDLTDARSPSNTPPPLPLDLDRTPLPLPTAPLNPPKSILKKHSTLVSIDQLITSLQNRNTFFKNFDLSSLQILKDPQYSHHLNKVLEILKALDGSDTYDNDCPPKFLEATCRFLDLHEKYKDFLLLIQNLRQCYQKTSNSNELRYTPSLGFRGNNSQEEIDFTSVQDTLNSVDLIQHSDSLDSLKAYLQDNPSSLGTALSERLEKQDFSKLSEEELPLILCICSSLGRTEDVQNILESILPRGPDCFETTPPSGNKIYFIDRTLNFLKYPFNPNLLSKEALEQTAPVLNYPFFEEDVQKIISGLCIENPFLRNKVLRAAFYQSTSPVLFQLMAQHLFHHGCYDRNRDILQAINAPFLDRFCVNQLKIDLLLSLGDFDSLYTITGRKHIDCYTRSMVFKVPQEIIHYIDLIHLCCSEDTYALYIFESSGKASHFAEFFTSGNYQDLPLDCLSDMLLVRCIQNNVPELDKLFQERGRDIQLPYLQQLVEKLILTKRHDLALKLLEYFESDVKELIPMMANNDLHAIKDTPIEAKSDFCKGLVSRFLISQIEFDSASSVATRVQNESARKDLCSLFISCNKLDDGLKVIKTITCQEFLRYTYDFFAQSKLHDFCIEIKPLIKH